MVLGDQSSQFAAGHVRHGVCLSLIVAEGGNLGVHGLHVIIGGLGSQFRVHGGIKSAQLLRCLCVEFGCFGASLLQLTLRDFQLVSDHLQVALEVCIGLFIDGEPVFHRRHVLLRVLQSSLNLICYGLLGGVQLCRIRPA